MDHYLKKELYELVKKDERIFEFIQNGSLDGMWYWDLENPEHEWMSERFWKVLGYDPAEMKHSPDAWQGIINADDLQLALDNLQKHCENPNYPYDQVVRYKHKNNSTVWIRCRGIAIRDENQKPIRLLGAHQDISQVKTDHIALKKSEERYRHLIETASDAIYLINEEGIIVDTNHLAEKILKRTREELLGCEIEIADPNFSTQQFIEYWKNIAFDEQKIFETTHITSDGELIPIEISGRKFKVDDEIFYYGIARNITERKIAEKKLIESEEKFRGFFNYANTGMAIADRNNKLLTINPKFSGMLGFSQEELLALDFMRLTHKKDLKKELSLFQKVVNGELSYYSLEKRMIKKNGKELWVEASITARRDQDGKILMYIAMANDISKRKSYETKLKKAKRKAEEANRLKTEFLHNMSHEIRTPMNGIIGFSEMLEKPNLPTEKQKYYTKIIQNSSHQLLRVIDDILEISTLETRQISIHKENININDLLMELFSVFSVKAQESQTPIYLRKCLRDEESRIISDRTKLVKILSNLIENAIKFTYSGSIEIGCKIIRNKLNIYVKDTGIGISEENKSLIFERFSQGENELSQKQGGLGLGLSISKENAELLGGSIKLDSEIGKGSTFTLVIPYKAAVGSGKEKKIPLTENSEKSVPLILIVEDEEMNYLFTEALLENEYDKKLNLLHAKSGEEAIQICKSRKNISLILMDIKMPGMNGYETTSIIKSQFPNIPVIAQTAYTMEAVKQKSLASGCDAFISKPLEKDALFRIINEYLGNGITAEG